jgi:hypothetical protein
MSKIDSTAAIYVPMTREQLREYEQYTADYKIKQEYERIAEGWRYWRDHPMRDSAELLCWLISFTDDAVKEHDRIKHIAEQIKKL